MIEYDVLQSTESARFLSTRLDFFADSLHRPPDHLQGFLLAELGTKYAYPYHAINTLELTRLQWLNRR